MTDRDLGAGEALTLTVVLASAMGVSTFASPSLGVLAPFLVPDLGLSATGLGLLVATSALSTAALAPVLGGVADRVGGRRALTLLFGLVILACLIMNRAGSVWVLVTGLIVSAVPNALGNPATNRMIVDAVPPRWRGAVLGGKQSGVQVGIATFGATLVPVALAWGWRSAFLVPAGMALLGMALTRLLPSDGSSGLATPRRREDPAAPKPRVYRLALYSALMGATTGAVIVFVPLYLEQELQLGHSAAGLAITGVGVVGFVGRIVLSWMLGDRISYTFPLVVFAALAVAGVILLAVAGPTTTFLAWMAIPILGVSTSTWTAIAMLAAISGSAAGAGAATGQVVTGFMGGYALGPLGFGALLDSSGRSFAFAWGVLAACAGLSAVPLLLGRPAGARRA